MNFTLQNKIIFFSLLLATQLDSQAVYGMEKNSYNKVAPPRKCIADLQNNLRILLYNFCTTGQKNEPPQLQTVTIFESDTTGASFKDLSKNISDLDIRDCPNLKDEHLEALVRRLPYLKRLILKNVPTTGGFTQYLSENIKGVYLWECENLKPEHLNFKRFRNLENLGLRDTNATALHAPRNLLGLDIEGSKITIENICYTIDNSPKLSELILSEDVTAEKVHKSYQQKNELYHQELRIITGNRELSTLRKLSRRKIRRKLRLSFRWGAVLAYCIVSFTVFKKPNGKPL